MKRGADEEVAGKRKTRQKKIKHTTPINIPVGSELCFCFPDGGSFAGVMKLIMLIRDDGNFKFTRDTISFVRSNSTRSILVDVVWKNKYVMIHGEPMDIPVAGFGFGVNLKDFHSMATRTLTKNDKFLIFFRKNDTVMFVEQVSYKTTGASRNETPFENKHVPTKGFTTRIIGTKNNPNVVVRAEEFFIQINLLYVAKYHHVIVECNKDGLRFTGANKDGDRKKSIIFTAAWETAEDEVAIHITNKKLKTLIHMRNISRGDSNIRIFFQHGMPLLFVCDMGPSDEIYGHFKLFLREEKKQNSQDD